MTTGLSLCLFSQALALDSVWPFTYLAIAVRFCMVRWQGLVGFSCRYTGCHGAYCPAVTFIYFLETPVGLEYQQEGKKMMSSLSLLWGYAWVSNTSLMLLGIPAAFSAFRNKMPLKPETPLVLNN